MTEQDRKQNARKMTWVALVVTALLALNLWQVTHGGGWLPVVGSLALTLTFSICWLRVAQLRRWL